MFDTNRFVHTRIYESVWTNRKQLHRNYDARDGNFIPKCPQTAFVFTAENPFTPVIGLNTIYGRADPFD